ncbi:TIGR00341 family protein [Hoylesella buccalis]|uniref:TIGR00341 family protein n=2 Tax=Hoylesella buccalis TaxID=28127 RepID=A0A2N6QRG3_9BACT|nr:TIGR00341 family protein [Hoylesella buccalis]
MSYNMEKISLKAYLRQYFDMSENREKEEDVVDEIASGVTFKGANLWILICAVFIASLGLNINSTAVIIGAMLISPLMGPILGMGLAVGIDDLPLLRRAVKNYMVATIIGIITATVYFLLTPFQGVQSELLARTEPTIYDVLIAFFGGAAGIVAASIKDKGNVIPGVAIATALMPPLCTAGYGIATGNLAFFAGASLLYFINTVFIAVATTFGVFLLRFRRKHFVDPQRCKFVHRMILAIAILTMIPAGYMTVRMMRTSLFDKQLSNFVQHNLNWKGTQVISQHLYGDSVLQIVALGKEVTPEQKKKAQKELNEHSRLKHLKLAVIQGNESADLASERGNLLTISKNREKSVKVLQEQAVEIKNLREKLEKIDSYSQLSVDMFNEMLVLYPGVQSLVLSPVVEANLDTTANEPYLLAIAQFKVKKPLTNQQNNQMRQWIQKRTNEESVKLVITYTK